MERFEQLEAVNRDIREFAARIERIDPNHLSKWEFICECGLEDCTEHVRLPLSGYDELKTADDALLAPAHSRERARELRRQARAVRADAVAGREEAAALRNQALHQQRRAKRIAAEVRAQVPGFRCANCGYEQRWQTPPPSCLKCRSNEWQAVQPE